MRRRDTLLVCGLIATLLASAAALALQCAPRQQALAPAVAPPHQAGVLWEVRSPEGAVGHLLGTIHLALPAVTALSPQLRSVLDESSRFGMEVLFDPATLATVAALMQAPAEQGLRAQTEPALYRATLRLLRHYGVDDAAAARLKIWAAYTTLSLPPGQTGPPLDLLLMSRAERTGKPMFGIEKLAEQLAVFDTLTTADQLALLRDTVCHYADQQQDMQGLVAAYVAGDLGQLYAQALRWESPAETRLMSTLLDDRNARMAQRLLPEFKVAGTFVAVGALHLPGPGGLLERLTAAGYRVRAIDR